MTGLGSFLLGDLTWKFSLMAVAVIHIKGGILMSEYPPKSAFTVCVCVERFYQHMALKYSLSVSLQWLQSQMGIVFLTFPPCDKSPDLSNLRKVLAVWEYCPLWWGWEAAWWSGSGSRCVHIQEAETDKCQCSACFLLFMQLPSRGTALLSSGPHLLCVHPIETLPRRFPFSGPGRFLVTADFSAPANQYWLLQTWPCLLGGLCKGLEIWAIKVTKCSWIKKQLCAH